MDLFAEYFAATELANGALGFFTKHFLGRPGQPA